MGRYRNHRLRLRTTFSYLLKILSSLNIQAIVFRDLSINKNGKKPKSSNFFGSGRERNREAKSYKMMTCTKQASFAPLCPINYLHFLKTLK